MGPRTWLSSIKDRFNARDSGIRGGIDYLSREGRKGEVLDKIEELESDASLEWSGKFSAAILPGLHIAKNQVNFRRIDGFLDYYKYWEELNKFNKRLQEPELIELSEKLKNNLLHFTKLITGISVDDPETAKNLVINRNVVLVDSRHEMEIQKKKLPGANE